MTPPAWFLPIKKVTFLMSCPVGKWWAMSKRRDTECAAARGAGRSLTGVSFNSTHVAPLSTCTNSNFVHLLSLQQPQKPNKTHLSLPWSSGNKGLVDLAQTMGYDYTSYWQARPLDQCHCTELAAVMKMFSSCTDPTWEPVTTASCWALEI